MFKIIQSDRKKVCEPYYTLQLNYTEEGKYLRPQASNITISGNPEDLNAFLTNVVIEHNKLKKQEIKKESFSPDGIRKEIIVSGMPYQILFRATKKVEKIKKKRNRSDEELRELITEMQEEHIEDYLRRFAYFFHYGDMRLENEYNLMLRELIISTSSNNIKSRIKEISTLITHFILESKNQAFLPDTYLEVYGDEFEDLEENEDFSGKLLNVKKRMLKDVQEEMSLFFKDSLRELIDLVQKIREDKEKYREEEIDEELCIYKLADIDFSHVQFHDEYGCIYDIKLRKMADMLAEF